MSINKWYEIECDNCGDAIGYYKGTKGSALKQASKDGAILKSNKQFCCKKCCKEGRYQP